MHIDKYKANGVFNVLKHDEPSKARAKQEHVDNERTAKNYNVLNTNGLTAFDVYKEEMESGRFTKQNRADVNTLCSICLTAPDGLPEAREEEFFYKACVFFMNRYKNSPCVSAWVHKDEQGRPHMHYKFIPVAEGKKGLRVNASGVVTRSDLRTLHQDFKKYIDKEMGLDLPIINKATARGNKSVAELKAETLQKQVAELENRVKALKEIEGDKKTKIYELKQKFLQLEKENKELQRQISFNQSRLSKIKTEIFKIEGEDFTPIFNQEERSR